MFVQVTKYT